MKSQSRPAIRAVAAVLTLSVVFAACEGQQPPIARKGDSSSAADAAPGASSQSGKAIPGAQPLPETMSAVEALRESEATGSNSPLLPSPPTPWPSAIHGGERYPELSWQGFRETTEAPLSTFGVDVDTASYVHVRRLLQAGKLPPADAVRIEEMLNYFDYDYPRPESAAQPFTLSAAVLPTPWDPETRLLHVGLQGYNLPAVERPPLNLVLLVDVSGSMEGVDRLGLAKQAFGRFLDRLDGEDRVSLVTFNNGARVILEPTPVRRKAAIRAALDALRAGGGTAGSSGLELAYEMAEQGFDREAVNRVMLISDGDFNVGLSDPNGIRRFIAGKRESGIYLSVLTVGGGNVNDHIAQALAHAGNGQAAHLDSLLEARKVLSDELEANLLPIANDVKLQVEFNPSRVLAYRLIGYETRALRDRDFLDDRIDAGDIGSGHQVTALYEIVPVGADRHGLPPLRYRQPTEDDGPAVLPPETSDEYAYLKLRYKRPGGGASREMARAIAEEDRYASLEAAPADLRFAVAVVVFGQVLRGQLDQRDGAYREVLSLAGGARGGDPLGIRGEFIQLVRMAESLDGGW